MMAYSCQELAHAPEGGYDPLWATTARADEPGNSAWYARLVQMQQLFDWKIALPTAVCRLCLALACIVSANVLPMTLK
jgi:hypothetical protein